MIELGLSILFTICLFLVEIKKAILKFFNETNINEMIENINQIKEQYSWSIFTKKLLALTNSKKNNITS